MPKLNIIYLFSLLPFSTYVVTIEIKHMSDCIIHTHLVRRLSRGTSLVVMPKYSFMMLTRNHSPGKSNALIRACQDHVIVVSRHIAFSAHQDPLKVLKC